MKNKPITKETERELINLTDLALEEVSQELDNTRKFINEIATTKKNILNKKTSSKSLEDLESHLEYRLLIILIYLDLASAIRAFLYSKHSYQRKTHLRQIIVILNEGFKQIFNFIIVNDKGDQIRKYRNNSFWIKEIGSIVKNSMPELEKDFNLISDKLENYSRANLPLKIQRDLSIHYDKKPSKVYDMIGSLNVNKTFLQMVPFLDILNKMNKFSRQLLESTYEKQKVQLKELKEEVDQLVQKLEKLSVENKPGTNRGEITDLKKQAVAIKTQISKIRPAPNND